jgi:thioredoxin 1
MNSLLWLIVVPIVLFMVYVYISAKRFKNMPPVEESKNIINLDEKNFQQTTMNTLALVDFWAEWCMPCKMMTPILNEVSNEVEGNVKICKVNIDNHSSLAAKFSVRSIPTLLLLKNGKEINRFVGVKQKDFLLKQIKAAI